MPRTPLGGSNSAPPDPLIGFCREERKGKREVKGKERERKGRGGKRKKEWEGKVRDEKRGGQRRGGGRERGKGKGKGGILCSCDFSLGKTLPR